MIIQPISRQAVATPECRRRNVFARDHMLNSVLVIFAMSDTIRSFGRLI